MRIESGATAAASVADSGSDAARTAHAARGRKNNETLFQFNHTQSRSTRAYNSEARTSYEIIIETAIVNFLNRIHGNEFETSSRMEM